MKFTLAPKTKKRIDLLIEPVKTGDWEQELRWCYYDDFKLNPQNYPHLSHMTYNKNYDSHSASYIKQ